MRHLAVWVLLALAVGGPLVGQGQGQEQAKERGPKLAQGSCAEDAKKLCPGVERGQGRMRACLKQHEGELSEACKQQITVARTRSGACAGDIERLCSQIEPGKGAIRACLSEHLDELSPECKAQVGSRGGKRRRR